MNDRYLNVNYCLVCGSKLTIKPDKEKKLRPQCQSCNWIYYKNHVPAVACVVINNLDQILLVKRKYEPQVGFWALPSGYMEIWQTPEDTAKDELLEETGLIGEIENFIGYYSGYSKMYEKVLSMGFKMKIIGGTLEAGDDAEEAVFFDFDKMPEIAFLSHRDFLLKCNVPVKHSEFMI